MFGRRIGAVSGAVKIYRRIFCGHGWSGSILTPRTPLENRNRRKERKRIGIIKNLEKGRNYTSRGLRRIWLYQLKGIREHTNYCLTHHNNKQTYQNYIPDRAIVLHKCRSRITHRPWRAFYLINHFP